MVGFSIGSGNVNGGSSSSSFSNLSPLAPPFTLDRSVSKPTSTTLVDMTESSFGFSFNASLHNSPPFTLDRSVSKPISTTLVDMTESSFGFSFNSSLHNWLPPTSQNLPLDYFSNPTSEFNLLSPSIEPSDNNHVPLLGSFSISSTDTSIYGDSSDSLTTCIGKAKPYYPSYVSTLPNKGSPMVIVDQPSYDWLSNSHVATFDIPSCKNYSQGSSGSERSVEEASHCIDMLDLTKCGEFVREQPNEDLLLDGSFNNVPIENLRIPIMDAYSAFPGCHPKTKISPLNPATSSQSCQILKNAPYQDIFSKQDARRSETTTSVVNSPATFSIRPPVVNTDSFGWNIGPCRNSDYGYDLAEGKQGGNNLSNIKDFLPFNLENEAYYDTENHVTCIDKNDPVITKSSSVKTQDLPKNICVSKDSSDPILKAEVGHHNPNVSPHLSLNLKTIETATAFGSSSESFDQYNLAVDSPCWKGAPVSRVSPFEAFDIATSHQVKKVETCDSVNFSLPQIPPCIAEDTVKVFVHQPNESIIERNLEKGSVSSSKMPSVASASLAEQKTSYFVKARDFYSKRGCFHPASNNIYGPVEDDGDSDSSYSLPHDNYQNNLESGIRISSTSCMEKCAVARSNSGNSSGDGFSYLLCNVEEHVQHFPSCTEDKPSKLTKAGHGEPNSKTDIQILVDAVHNLSELLLAHCSNGMGALLQKDVKTLQNVMGNLDMCIKNSVGPQGSISPEQRTSQNLGKFHHLYRDVGVPKVYEDNMNKVYEDNMTKALKKVLSENFHDEEVEQEHPQTLLYKNLWFEAEAALCAFNFRARFSRGKLEIDKNVSSKVTSRENAKNQDEEPVSNDSPGPSTIGKLACETKGGAAPFNSVQTSPAVSASNHADDVMTRFHILKCRDDETKSKNTECSGKPSGFKVSVEPDMVEKSALDNQQTAVPDIKDMDSHCPTSEVMVNDFATALAPTSPILTRSSHIDDVMSRFQILKSRDEFMNSLNPAKLQQMSSSNYSEFGTISSKRDAIISPGISMKYPPNADDKNEVDNLDTSSNVLRNHGNIMTSTPAGGQLREDVNQHSASKRDYWPIVENKAKGGGFVVEMEPFLRLEPGVSAKHDLAGKESNNTHVEDMLPSGCFDGNSSDWEHVLWGD